MIDSLGRIVAETDDGPVYGVARLRYDEGHAHAGQYEVERADGTSFLSPGEALRPGPNWDVTPEEGRFVGAEFFRPAFLDETRRRFLKTGPGVLVPGDMEALRALAERIEPGWQVHWFNSCPNTFRGLVTVGSVTGGSLVLEKPREPSWGFSWPTSGIEMGAQYGHEFEVQGNTFLRLDVGPRRYGKAVSIGLSLKFEPPRKRLY